MTDHVHTVTMPDGRVEEFTTLAGPYFLETPPDGLDGAGAAAEQRIAESPEGQAAAGDQGGQGGQQPPPAGGQQGGGQQQGGDGGDLLYRDAAELREELVASRTKWGPFQKAFEGMGDEARAALLEHAPLLGDDLAYIGQQFGGLPPGDRQVLANIVGMIPENPAGAAEMLRQAADILAGGDGSGGAADQQFGAGQEYDWSQGYYDPQTGQWVPPEEIQQPAPDPMEQPITRGEWAQFQQEEQFRQAEAKATDDILTEARALGYDPESKDQGDQLRFMQLVSIARGQPDGNLQEAHKLLQGQEQRAIDQYVQGKRSDGQRPAPPAGGQAPSGERALESMDDPMKAAEQAMRSRLDANLEGRQRVR